MRWTDTCCTVGKHFSGISKESAKCQEGTVKISNETKSMMVAPGKILAKQPLSHYRNGVLSTSAGELAGILFKVRSRSSVFASVEKAITVSDPNDRGNMARSHLRRYWADGSSARNKSVWAR